VQAAQVAIEVAVADEHLPAFAGLGLALFEESEVAVFAKPASAVSSALAEELMSAETAAVEE
jgi:hypothetical protein